LALLTSLSQFSPRVSLTYDMSVKVYELLAAGHIDLRFEVTPGETRQALISLVRSHARLGTPESFERE
jgi:hypothetical protein